MAQTTGSTTLQSESGEGGERVPIMQQILDNPFLLLFIGVTVPTTAGAKVRQTLIVRD